MNFTLHVNQQSLNFGNNVDLAHDCLKAFADGGDLDIHIHQGNWEGNALSTAYRRGGDPLLDSVATVSCSRD